MEGSAEDCSFKSTLGGGGGGFFLALPVFPCCGEFGVGDPVDTQGLMGVIPVELEHGGLAGSGGAEKTGRGGRRGGELGEIGL